MESPARGDRGKGMFRSSGKGTRRLPSDAERLPPCECFGLTFPYPPAPRRSLESWLHARSPVSCRSHGSVNRGRHYLLQNCPSTPNPPADTLPSHCSASPRQAGCTSYIPIRQPDPHGTASPSMTCLVSRPGSSHRLGAPFGPGGNGFCCCCCCCWPTCTRRLL